MIVMLHKMAAKACKILAWMATLRIKPVGALVFNAKSPQIPKIMPANRGVAHRGCSLTLVLRVLQVPPFSSRLEFLFALALQATGQFVQALLRFQIFRSVYRAYSEHFVVTK